MRVSHLALIPLLVFTIAVTSGCSTSQDDVIDQETNQGQELLEFDLSTNTEKTSIDLDELVSGGPVKDAIPALTNPEFEALADSTIPDDIRGVLLDIDGEKRFYPYNVMVWHEVANDTIAGTPVTVTF